MVVCKPYSCRKWHLINAINDYLNLNNTQDLT
jgi:hypothetical protein